MFIPILLCNNFEICLHPSQEFLFLSSFASTVGHSRSEDYSNWRRGRRKLDVCSQWRTVMVDIRILHPLGLLRYENGIEMDP